MIFVNFFGEVSKGRMWVEWNVKLEVCLIVVYYLLLLWMTFLCFMVDRITILSGFPPFTHYTPLHYVLLPLSRLLNEIEWSLKPERTPSMNNSAVWWRQSAIITRQQQQLRHPNLLIFSLPPRQDFHFSLFSLSLLLSIYFYFLRVLLIFNSSAAGEARDFIKSLKEYNI